MSDHNPLTQLHDALADDMRAVNEAILARMTSDVPLIPQLASYLIAAGGKRIRPLLTLASTRLFDDKTDRPHKLAASVEFIHTATLLHDDIVDGSEERRGKPAANLVFGNTASVLVGDFLFSRAFELMAEDGELDILQILSHASAVIAEGEVLQLSAVGQLGTDQETYLKIIGAKTAALFEATCEIGPIMAGADDAARKALKSYGYNLGMAFQIADDVLDYAGQGEAMGKNSGDDFYDGKVTLPVIHAYTNGNGVEQAFWQRTLGDKDFKDGDLETAQKYIADHAGKVAALTLARQYADQAVNDLKNITDSPLKSNLIACAQYTVDRLS